MHRSFCPICEYRIIDSICEECGSTNVDRLGFVFIRNIPLYIENDFRVGHILHKNSHILRATELSDYKPSIFDGYEELDKIPNNFLDIIYSTDYRIESLQRIDQKIKNSGRLIIVIPREKQTKTFINTLEKLGFCCVPLSTDLITDAIERILYSVELTNDKILYAVKYN